MDCDDAEHDMDAGIEAMIECEEWMAGFPPVEHDQPPEELPPDDMNDEAAAWAAYETHSDGRADMEAQPHTAAEGSASFLPPVHGGPHRSPCFVVK